jgi:hypothetical protein
MLMEKLRGLGSSCREFLGEVASGQSYDEKLMEMRSAVRVTQPPRFKSSRTQI